MPANPAEFSSITGSTACWADPRNPDPSCGLRCRRLAPAEALSLIHENLASHANVVTLRAEDYLRLVEELAQARIAGGAVYDAIIARAAELAGVDYLITLSLR